MGLVEIARLVILIGLNGIPFVSQSQGTAESRGEIVQRFICERSYTNFAWGYAHTGIYVDRDGGVYRFSVRSATLPRTAGSARTEPEMRAKYGPDAVRVRTVPRAELLANFRLIAAAAKGEYSPRVAGGADRGATVSSCYLFDGADGRYREVVLDAQGDWQYRNLSSEARKLRHGSRSFTARMFIVFLLFSRILFLIGRSTHRQRAGVHRLNGASRVPRAQGR
jgi:hypothetical protein